MGKFRQNPSHPKNFPAPTPLMKRHLRPRYSFFDRAEGKCPRHASILRRPCAYYPTRTLFTGCCRLQCVTVMNINYQRSLKTEQFITAKIQSCANVSSHSNRAEKVCGWDVGHPGLTVWNLINYTRIENAHEVRKKIFVFYYVVVICTITEGKKRYRFVRAVMISPPEMPINDETHIASTGVRVY